MYGESRRDFLLFQGWLLSGNPRPTVAIWAAKAGHDVQEALGLAARWGWRIRADAWQTHINQVRVRGEIELASIVAERNAYAARTSRDMAHTAALAVKAKLQEAKAGAAGAVLEPREIASWLRSAIRFNPPPVPPAVADGAGEIDYDAMPAEDLEALARILSRARPG